MEEKAEYLELNDIERKACEVNLSSDGVDSDYVLKDMVDFSIDIVCDTVEEVAYVMSEHVVGCFFSIF